MAMVLQAILPKMCNILVRMVEDEIGMLLGILGEIEKLREMLSDINNVIEDAERRRINNRAIEKWLKDLRDVMYDVDDILDLCGIKAEERKCQCHCHVGVGGIGKTTLAHKVFDDQKIKVEFQKRVWICVSQDYNEIEILKDVRNNLDLEFKT